MRIVLFPCKTTEINKTNNTNGTDLRELEHLPELPRRRARHRFVLPSVLENPPQLRSVGLHRPARFR